MVHSLMSSRKKNPSTLLFPNTIVSTSTVKLHSVMKVCRNAVPVKHLTPKRHYGKSFEQHSGSKILNLARYLMNIRNYTANCIIRRDL